MALLALLALVVLARPSASVVRAGLVGRSGRLPTPREAQERAGRAQEDRSAAQERTAKAENLDPGLRQDATGPIRRHDAVAAEEPVRGDETGGSGGIRR